MNGAVWVPDLYRVSWPGFSAPPPGHSCRMSGARLQRRGMGPPEKPEDENAWQSAPRPLVPVQSARRVLTARQFRRGRRGAQELVQLGRSAKAAVIGGESDNGRVRVIDAPHASRLQSANIGAGQRQTAVALDRCGRPARKCPRAARRWTSPAQIAPRHAGRRLRLHEADLQIDHVRTYDLTVNGVQIARMGALTYGFERRAPAGFPNAARARLEPVASREDNGAHCE